LVYQHLAQKVRRKMNNSSRRILAAAAALVLAGVGSCSDREGAPGGSGFIEAVEITVSSEIAGQARAVRLDEGSRVAAGDTIAEIDTVSTALRLQQALSGKDAAEKRARIASIDVEQATYSRDLARKEYDRAEALIASGSTNQQQLDQVETAYKQAVLAGKQAAAAVESARADLVRAESDVKLLNKQMEDCFPRATMSGVVTTRFIRAGEWVGVGKPIVKIASLDTVWVKIYVPAGDLTRIRIGGQAAVDPEDGRGRTLDGTVTWISDEAEFTPKNVQTKEARADLVYAVKVTIANPDGALKIGMPVAVKMR
jgi:HlyD family secretion protein